VFIKRVQVRGFLSYDTAAPSLSLDQLNVFIGPNGAGKSNLIEALRLLKDSTGPGDALTNFLIRDGSGVDDWLWKGEPGVEASIEVVFELDPSTSLRYFLRFRSHASRLEVTEERLESEALATKTRKPKVTYIKRDGSDIVLPDRQTGRPRTIPTRDAVGPAGTLLGVYRAPVDYPMNARVFDEFNAMQFYADPVFGRNSQIRRPQSTALPNLVLAEDGSNLALVLNRVLKQPGARERITMLVKQVFPYVSSVDTSTANNRIEVEVVENGWSTRSTRLSDGTMRWIFLITLLLDRGTTGPVFLDEPDLGLHPDALRELAKLLKEASEYKQIIVATHNVTLMDHFTDRPEAVVAFDFEEGKDGRAHNSVFKRVEKDAVPEGMLLGEAWQRGLVGGVRW
jgi:predicted ATPase